VDEERGLKRILSVMVIVQEAAADALYHRGVPPHQSSKGVIVPAAQETRQEFPIGHAAPVRPDIGHEVLDDHAQWLGRHRLVPRLYLIVLAAGRFDPPL
jgi:hypothetical protein